MKTTTVLFDLDGTLLPMDQNTFAETYFGLLAKKLQPHGYESEKLIKTIWAGTAAMVANCGEKTNEEVFWDTFCSVFGEKARLDLPVFEEFYEKDFERVKDVCGFNPSAAKTVELVKKCGLRAALATNPLFPRTATMSRLRWAGLDPRDFELITTYDNSNFCKPSLKYYEQIIFKLGVNAEECAIVGNDVSEDMIAEKLGMKTFLLTDNLINKSGEDISCYPHGSFDELDRFIASL